MPQFELEDISLSLLLFSSCIVAWIALEGPKKQRKTRKVSDSSKAEVLAQRKRYFSSSLSVSYENSNPLMIMKGSGSRLIDEEGISYLDTRNNVAHVGHSHPKIVQAIQDQIANLNTNTRYLHPTVCTLAERLVELMPQGLNKVFFCNSGSEANDLALRLARAATKRQRSLCMEHAYHGHTLAVLHASPYKFRKSGEPFDTTATVIPCPDSYRKKNMNALDHVKQACSTQDVCAMIVEGGMSVAGVHFPDLTECAAVVRQSGGVWIADEVQTGFGRLGTCMWAFQYRDPDFVPDMVTIGKPFGNGMPLAAVVTTEKVAKAFEKCHVEYFNTFAGNPVCAAAGLAMLDVLEAEHLQHHAMVTGKYLADRFIKAHLPIVGDVRGSGLFIGIELVRDDGEPATQETSFICSQLKSVHHILTSVDGPSDNVLVIKPPLAFSKKDSDVFVDCFVHVVAIDLPVNAEKIKLQERTPT